MIKRKLSGMEFNNNFNQKFTKNLKVDSVPLYQVHIAAQSYSNIASVLAGFALTLIFLIFQIPNMDQNPDIANFVAITLSIAFFGSIITSFVFATLSGDPEAVSRSHSIAFLGGTGYVVMVNLFIVALYSILKINFTYETKLITYYLFLFSMIASPLFAIFSAVDSYIVRGKKIKVIKKQILHFYIGSIIILPLLKKINFIKSFEINSIYVYIILFLSLIVLFSSTIFSMFISTDKTSDFHFSKYQILGITLLNSFMVGLLSLLL